MARHPFWLTLIGVALAVSGSGAQCPTRWLGSGSDFIVYGSGLWDPDGTGPMTDRLVVGGGFSSVGGVPARFLAIMDQATGRWSALPSSTSGTPWTFASMPNGDLVVGGNFRQAGAIAASNIARWDGQAWRGFGWGVNHLVYAVAVLPSGDVVAGGLFTNAGGTAANYIARWDGTAWHALGAGTNAPVNALVVMPNGDLIAGGNFTAAGGVPAIGTARWDGTAWHGMGGTVNPVNALVVLPNGDLVAGGNGLARWDGAQWHPASGAPNFVLALAAHANGDVAVGGGFASAGGVAASNLVRWSGGSWSTYGSGTAGGSSPWVHTLSITADGDLYAGGRFTTVDGVPAPYLARQTMRCNASVAPVPDPCTGPGGRLSLTASGPPVIGAMYTGTASGFVGGSLAVSVVGLSVLNTPLEQVLPQGTPGCRLLPSTEVLQPSAPVGGTASHAFFIPGPPTAAGLVLWHQFVQLELDPTGALRSVSSSNGLQLSLGL